MRRNTSFEEEDPEVQEDYLNRARNLLYVDMTRARFQLYMFTVHNENEAAFPSTGTEEKPFEITLNTSAEVLASSEKISKPIQLSYYSSPSLLVLDYPYLEEVGRCVYEINLWNLSLDGGCHMSPLKVQRTIHLQDIEDIEE